MKDRLKSTIVPFARMKGCTVKSVSTTHRKEGQVVLVKSENETFVLLQDITCCEFVEAKLPPNIENINNRQISSAVYHCDMYEMDNMEYEPIGNIEIIDSTGELYFIEFAARSAGCMYIPSLIAEKEWIECVFN